MRGIEQYLQVDAATLGALKYAGTWNASTNTPTLASGVGTQGQYYVVSVAGSTNLDGETNWQVGDWAVFNGSVWQKVDGGSTGLLSTLTVTGNTFLATTSGNVGVGTVGPAVKLQVNSASSGATLELLRLSNTGTGANTKSRLNFYAASTNYGAITAGFGASAPEMVFDINTTNGAFIWNSVSTERMRITSTGDVGIGTSSPASKLHVVGDIQQDNANYIKGKLAAGTATRLFGLNAANSLYIGGIDASQSETLFTRGGTTQMTLDASGNLGIGTSTPAVKLDVANGFAIIGANSANPGVGGNIRFRDDTGTPRWLSGLLGTAGATAYSIYDIVAGAERLSITSTGDVGIGTSSPSGKLDVAGSIGTFRIESSGARVVLTRDDANYIRYGSTNGILIFEQGATERMRITSAGDVGIGTSSPGYRLDVYKAGAASISAARSDTQAVLRSEVGACAADLNVVSTYGEVRTATNHPLLFSTNATERMRLDASGNLGLGVTPSAWGATSRSLTVNAGAFFSGRTDAFRAHLGLNAYESASDVWRYSAALAASRYTQIDGQHQWFTAPSGTAGNTISFTQAMTLDASGNLLVGTTSNPGVLNTSVVVNSGASSLAGLVLQNNTTGSTSTDGSHITIVGTELRIVNLENAATLFSNNGSERMRITSAGNIHTPAGATTMTNGFFYIPAAAGVPTGVPTAITGTVPMYYDTTNNKFYVYNGAWKSVTLT
jgi:hypothetical protein